MKVVNLPAPVKKGSMSRTAKPKFAKRGDDSSEICSDIILYRGGLPAGPVEVKGRHLHQSRLPLPRGEYVISKFYLSFILIIYGASLQLTPYVYLFLFFFPLGSLSKRKTFRPLTPYCLISPSLRYIPFLCKHLHCHVSSCAFSLLHVYLSLFFLNIRLFFLG